MTVRVYVPLTPRSLARAAATGEVGPAPLLAHAVTDTVRRELSGAGEEDWEYAASSAASLASLTLLARELGQGPPPTPGASGTRPCRVVLAVDAPSVRAPQALDEPALGAVAEDPTLVVVQEPVPWRRVAAVLADAPSAASAVAAAGDALVTGDPAADRLVERCLDHDLGWWATQEVADLLASLGRAR